MPKTWSSMPPGCRSPPRIDSPLLLPLAALLAFCRVFVIMDTRSVMSTSVSVKMKERPRREAARGWAVSS